MYQGFYQLTSGMLTQQRNLNTISNNMSNIETAGYKKNRMTISTFGDAMMIRTGRTDKNHPKELGIQSPVTQADESVTDFSQGAVTETGQKYDFAIMGEGFFNIQTPAGVRYTRNGSFSLDADGTLQLSGIGPVLGQDGNPIRLRDENVTMDHYGRILYSPSGEVAGQIRITGFPDTGVLVKQDNGIFSAAGQGTDLTGQTEVLNGSLERSNTDLTEEMTEMMSSQRALQGAAQMLRMYDSVLDKATSSVGQV